MLNNQSFKWILSLIILVILIFGFYWHQLRPNQIIRVCAEKSLAVLDESDYYDTAKYENTYRSCLRLNGIEQ